MMAVEDVLEAMRDNVFAQFRHSLLFEDRMRAAEVYAQLVEAEIKVVQHHAGPLERLSKHKEL